ncbi:response regulator transcription factor [Alteromonas oceanisediminis]|uniref:response regulator transcription factor n=1 Tax=Alteromonas oceanisediminis TaxID=2836180 RepID=UPI001BDB6713|nr:response regulator transcription factor [Alteromonas oceanisediminis]MBT0587088.1 response regulator transcription factor [Alteromonas oceanisediminis]
MKILIADDERSLSHFLQRGLRAEGFECESVNELHEVVPAAKRFTPDIVVLDRLFGELDSIDTVQSLKHVPSPPMILMLTALDDVAERVNGLKAGADDYLCKPFDFDELLARLSALTRRTQNQGKDLSSYLTLGTLVLSSSERLAYVNEQEIALTKIEFELLMYFAENAHKVLSRERILSRVWQTYSDPNTNIVDVYVSRLRKRIENSGVSIQTLRGNGYRLATL